jgi:hypothetical protein
MERSLSHQTQGKLDDLISQLVVERRPAMASARISIERLVVEGAHKTVHRCVIPDAISHFANFDHYRTTLSLKVRIANFPDALTQEPHKAQRLAVREHMQAVDSYGGLGLYRRSSPGSGNAITR